eukprot:jgi/Orpsp1_1/1186773/evm.model.d7180000053208.1
MIDKEIQKDKQRLKKEIKMLLLGPGESGKSTIVKQMKIINQNGYTTEELEGFKQTVYQNVLDCFFSMLEKGRTMVAFGKLDKLFENPENEELAEKLENDKEAIMCSSILTKELADDIHSILIDPYTEKIMNICYENPKDYYLIDSTQ